MNTRKLGWTDLELTTVGLGTWAQGGGGWVYGWGPQDDRDSIAAIRRALDLGVNWVDTAAVYGFGHAEEVLGKALKGLGRKPLVATKCTRVADGKGNLGGDYRAASIRAEAEASLKRLGVDMIDLYQMHWPASDAENLEAWETIARLAEEGKVRYAGVSNFSAAQIRRIQPVHPVASLQPPYSMLRRDIEPELLGFCRDNSIGVIVYSPMQKGMLTDKFTRVFVDGLAVDDHRRRDSMFQGALLARNLDLVAGLREIAARRGRTVAQLAVAWCLRRSEVTAAIVGARRSEQIEDTAGAADWELAPEDVAEVEALLARRGGGG